MYPPSLPEWLYRVVDLGWIGGLLSLVGFLSRGDRAALLVAGVISLLGLAALPALVGLLATPPLEWEVAVAGLLAGAVVSARFARRIRTSAAPPPLSSPTT
jgi:membrane associated rhomboid family serine protease